jgi:glutamyl-tRNA reductase
MNLIGISINHRTSSVELRESLNLNRVEIISLINELKQNILKEGLIISTCNRTEVLGIARNEKVTFDDLIASLMNLKKVEKISADNFEKFKSLQVVKHLFNLVTGIDSMMIGDNQIFKQVKDSFQISDEQNFIGFYFKKIMDFSLHIGKRAITETAISEGAVTVSFAAVQLIEKIFSNLSKKTVLIIGTGETGEIAAKHLRERGVSRLALTNRTFEKAEKLAKELNTAVFPFDSFKEHLHKFDIIVSATGSQDFILSKSDIEKAMVKRNFDSMVIVDIAVPRDVDPDCRKIENVFYNDIDSLNIIVEQNLNKRRNEIPKVEKLIGEEINKLNDWLASLQVTPIIKALRDKFDSIRFEEVENNINRFSADDKEKLEIVTKKIINKILHHPTVELKKIANDESTEELNKIKLSLIQEIFGLTTVKEQGKNEA